MIKTTSNGQPIISATAFISGSAVIIGDVIIEDDVFVAPNATIRADEPGSKVVIRSGCNVQDNVVIHALLGSTAEIRHNSSLGHGCIVHGPCVIGEDCFIGFGSIVFQSVLGDACIVLHRAIVQDVVVPAGKVIGNGQIIENERQVKSLEVVPSHLADFARKVVETNRRLVQDHCRAMGRFDLEEARASTNNVNSS